MSTVLKPDPERSDPVKPPKGERRKPNFTGYTATREQLHKALQNLAKRRPSETAQAKNER
jgi:hypothetical protein